MVYEQDPCHLHVATGIKSLSPVIRTSHCYTVVREPFLVQIDPTTTITKKKHSPSESNAQLTIHRSMTQSSTAGHRMYPRSIPTRFRNARLLRLRPAKPPVPAPRPLDHHQCQCEGPHSATRRLRPFSVKLNPTPSEGANGADENEKAERYGEVGAS